VVLESSSKQKHKAKFPFNLFADIDYPINYFGTDLTEAFMVVDGEICVQVGCHHPTFF